MPRNIVVDLDPGGIAAARARGLFKPVNLVGGAAGTGGNWAQGYYGSGAEMVDGVMEVVRKEAEGTDALQGFQLTHSLGGGTGAGMGTLLISKIREEYPDRIIMTFSVLSSQPPPPQPYNMTLSVHQLVENTDFTVVLDNNALDSLTGTTANGDRNALAARAMAGATVANRFADDYGLQTDLRRFATQMVPFPRVQFLAPTCAGAGVPGHAAQLPAPGLTEQLFSGRNGLLGIDPQHGRYLTATALFQGPVVDADKSVALALASNSSYLTEWIPCGVHTIVCDAPAQGQATSATLLANTTAIQESFKRLDRQFNAMWQRRAFLSYYTYYGMDELEFDEALANMSDLVSEYQQYQDATADDEGELLLEEGYW